MADVSRSGYLSRKLAGINDESSKHIYDGIFSAPAAAKHNGSTFAARIDDYREIFPPSKASLGSSIPILDLPAVDRSVGPGRALSSGFDYTGVFGGFGDNDGIQVPSEKLFCDSQKTAKRDAQLPRIPAQMRRMPSKSQEFSCSYGNDQTSGSVQMMRIPSKSQEFSCNYENDQTSSLAQARRIPSKSQEFSCNYGNYQTSSPVQTRRMPSKSPEFSCKNGNDQTSSPAQMRSIPSKSQDFSCNNVIDQTSSAVQLRRMPSKSQEFSCNYGNDETSNLVQPRRMPSKSQEFQCNYGNNQTSSTVQPRSMPSISQEGSCNYGNDQASNTVQLRSMPSISQEVSCNYGTDQASSPMQQRRMPSKSQEFSIDYGNDQTSTPAQTRMQYSKSQEFSSNLSNNQMSTSPVETRGPFSRDDEVSGTSPNDQTSISAVSQQAVNNAKHVSVSYHKTNQLSKDGTNGTTHIAHLPAVPGYTLLFDEAGPVRKTGFDKAKRLSMDDADFSAAADKVSKQGKHTRAVSDLGTNQQVNLKAQACSMSVSNSPQSFGSSDYFKRSSSRRPNRSTSKLRRNGPRESSPVLEDELDVNSAAAISAAAMKKAIEEAEGKIRWAKAFLKELEGNGFIKPTLRDSFKVKVASGAEHSYETCGLNQNGTSKVKAARKKKCFNEEKGLKQNSYLNSKASDEHIHANEAGEIPPKVRLDIPSQNQPENEAAGSEQKLHVHATGMDAATISPSTETFETTNAHRELKSTERSCKHEGGGEWEAAKHLSQLFTGVKNRFVSFMSKQADSEKTVTPKDAPSKCESLEKPEDRAHEVRNVDPNKEREAALEHIEEKVEMDHSRCSVGGESAQDSTRISLDVQIDEAKENEVNASGSTLSPDIEVFTSKQCRPSAPEEELEYIQVQELASRANGLDQAVFPEVEGERLQEVREQNGEILDATVKIEHESQIGTLGLEEHDKAYDDEVRNWGVNGEAANEVPGLDPEMKSLDESLTHEVVTSRQVEGCNLKEIKMPTNALTKQEDVRMIEKTCRVEERYARVVGTEEISCGGEDIGRIAGQDITSETTEGASHVVDDVSEHDEHLAATDYMTDQDELFVSKNKEASMPYITNQYVECMNFSSEEKGRKATTPFEPKENVEPPQPVERASELIGEGICEETPCSVDVVDDDSEHDEYLPAVDDILEQDELLSSSRNGVTIVPEAVSQYASYVDLPLQKERLTEATSTTSAEPDGGRIEKSGSVQMTDELNGEYKSEGSGFKGEAVDQFLEHDDYFPVADDVCEKNEHPCFNRNVITCDQDENQHAEEGKVAVVAERSKRITTGAGASEFGGKEQPSSRQMANEFISEEETEKSMSARDRLDMDNMEKVIEEAHEASPSTYVEITECYTTFKFDQKHSVQETMNFAADIGPQIQDEESEVITREANEADEQDVSSHSGESSHKRRRWFENREKTGEFQQPVFFQGNERTLEMDPENTEGSTVEDRVEICVDETVNNSGEGVLMEQAGGGSDQDGEDLHSSEGSHRRRRWFENNGGKSQHSPLNGFGVTAEMNREIGQEYKHDVSSRSDTDNLVNERKDGADGMESSNLASDEAECRASTEAASHRRRRWFENGEVLGAAAQRPGSILEDSEATAARGEEIKVGADTTKQELREISSSEDLGNTHQSEGRSKEREKEKERLAVERAIREARQRAFAEARERAAAEARLKAAAATQDRSGKASCETKPLPDKASMDAKLRAERAAVERATAEARERALQKAMFEKFTYNSREKDPKYPNSGPSSSSGYSTAVPFTSDSSDGSITESPQRKKAISERNKRTMERAAKALEEKNMRDVVAQKEQAERNRFAGVLDAEVKRWSAGKEGNLRSLLSTLQYILGPDSGWQPIPLTDLVTTTAVRKAYKRAALCVHPDKLQQRRATVQHKYICEKVFDLLKDAWQKLNPDDR